MAIEPSINMRYFLENRLGARVLIVFDRQALSESHDPAEF